MNTKTNSLPLSLVQEAHQEYVSEFRCLNSDKTSHNNFLKGAKWSPDGRLILSASEDGRIRLYNEQDLELSKHEELENKVTISPSTLAPWLQTDEGELIYDFCWYPLMNLDDPESCFYASVSRDHPIHLFNPINASFLSYTPLDDAESLSATYSISISPNGQYLYGGSLNKIFVYDISRPGPPINKIVLSTRRSKIGQKGIISCFDFNETNNTIACGSYNKSVFIYDPQCKMAFVNCLLDPYESWGGVTTLKWYDENHIASAHRSDKFIRYWDVRNPSEPLFRFYRENTSPQRLSFDFYGDYLYCGDYQGNLLVYNIRKLSFYFQQKLQHSPIVSTSIHPKLPFILTASGTKSFREFDEISSDSEDGIPNEKVLSNNDSHFENFLRIWSFNLILNTDVESKG